MQMPWEIRDRPIGAKRRDLSTRFGNGRLHRYLGSQCPYCGVVMNRDGGFNGPQAPSRDHRVPVSRGGQNVPENIIICCRRCNEDKGSLRVEEYQAVLAGLASRLDIIWNIKRSVEGNAKLKKRHFAPQPIRIVGEPRCAGFTRPYGTACPITDDLQRTSYDSMGEKVTATLCTLCRSRLLNGPPMAWAS